jgi:integrin beta 3
MTLEQHVAQSVAAVLRPVLSDLTAVQKQMAAWESRWNDVTALRERVAVLEVRAPVAGPAGQKGDPGARGEPGLAGTAGEPGRDGRDGLDGKDGAPGLMGKDGAPGLAGTDGVGVTDALIGRDGHLVLTLADGRTKDIGSVVGKDGAAGRPGTDGAPGLHGKDGADGVGFEDLDLVFDDAAGWALSFTHGEQTKAFAVPLPWDAGPWQSGKTYHAGAGVMCKGCYWVAQATTTARPGDESAESRAWRLTVKCGRDGKPGRDGRNGVAE